MKDHAILRGLCLLQVVEPCKDGVFIHVDGLIRYLVSRDVPVHLAYSSVRSSDHLPRLVEFIRGAGGGVVDLTVSNGPGWRDLSAIRKLSGLIQSSGANVVHAHSSKAGGLARLLRMSRFCPPVVYTPNAYFGMHGSPNWSTRMFWAIERVLARCSMTINVSHDEAAFGQQRFGVRPDRQTVIPNAVDIHRYHPPSEEERICARSLFQLENDSIVLGVMARDSEQKDLGTLYRAFAAVAARQPKLRMLHVGQGNMDSLIAELGIAKRVSRVEYLADTTSFYHSIDALALSSLFEGLSIAALESLASGLPLILTYAPGNRDFFRLGLSHIWSAPVRDVTRFGAAIHSWLLDRSKSRDSNHREIACREFDPEVCYGRILELYKRINRSSD